MTMSEKSQTSDLFPMGSEELTLLQADSRAKICQSQETKKASTPKGQDYGQNSAELLATYDLDTQSWRTSQHSLVETTGGGLERFLETWPRSGMTQNGTAYRLPVLAHHILEIGSGLLPTPNAVLGHSGYSPGSMLRQANGETRPSGAQIGSSLKWHPWPTKFIKKGWINPKVTEWMMGFKIGHTDLKQQETQ